MDMAVEKVQQLHGSVANFTHVRLFGPEMDSCETIADWCDFYLARWYYSYQDRQNRIPVFIWPACMESSKVRLLAAAWNTLFITTAGSDMAIRERGKGPTWISMSFASIPGYVRLYLSLLHTFRWSSVFVVIDEASLGFYLESSAAFVKTVENMAKNVTLTLRRVSSLKSPDLDAILQDFRKVSRVFIFFGHAPILRRILVKAALSNMTNGDFVYIATQVIPIRATGNFTWKYGDADDQIAKEAFRSLILVDQYYAAWSLRPSVFELAAEIQKREVNQYNLTITPMDAIVRELVVSNQSSLLRDGATLAQYFFNKTFDTAAGSIYIDSYGQRLMDAAVMRYDGENVVPRPIFYQDAQTLNMQHIANWTWNGLLNYFPPDKPLCGFSGDQCLGYSVLIGWHIFATTGGP
ncbi:atrial natriuretic peptide receptor 3-like [Paramacrobiotus metropolitanus]|uniref:atrial natriuretic peptide receptor 3-like n=1 Tax=Paramacrobiotus metropolitanus TaxID=2943436 RepID=UPI0024457DAD|nr:atrial natriuretic peptide receptor 3-like [Paramacrobiotus metropolitanus]